MSAGASVALFVLGSIGCGETGSSEAASSEQHFESCSSKCEPLWARTFESNWTDARKITFDRQGNTVVLGKFNENTDVGCGPMAGAGDSQFVVKFDPKGTCLWARSVSGSPANGKSPKGAAWDVIGSVFDDTGAITVLTKVEGTVRVGEQTSAPLGAFDMLVVKYDASGNVSYFSRFGGEGRAELLPKAIGASKDGGVWVTGWTRGKVALGEATFQSEYAKNFVARLTPDGKVAVAKIISGPGADDRAVSVESMAVAADGSVVLVGDNAFPVQIGQDTLPPSPSRLANAAIVKLDANGTPLWARNLGNLEPISGHMAAASAEDVAVDPDGTIFVSGEVTGRLETPGGAIELGKGESADPIVARVSATGQVTWIRPLKGANSPVKIALAGGAVWTSSGVEKAVDLPGGTVTVTGPRALVTRHSLGGNLEWAHAYGAEGIVSPSTFDVSDDGHIALTGYTSGASLGSTKLHVGYRRPVTFAAVLPTK
jgi:hypothetical protein